METEFNPTRTAALERLSAFLPKAGRAYASKRNFDLGASRHTENVSCLSTYLRCRLITETEVLDSVLARHSYSAAEKFIQEVYWRTYLKGWLELRPSVWGQYQVSLSRQWHALQTQSGLRDRWEAACKGETGIGCFDHWALELATTGYLHNHARMWFASIWIFTLELPWELGADFFLRHLLDGDPASNTLGWRWVAGIQTPGKTYLARTSNISKYTEGRFHPKWQLASEAPAMTGPATPPAGALPALERPDPDLKTGFLLHEEDLSPGYVLDQCQPVACAVLTPQTAVGPLHPAPQVATFRQAAQTDALNRLTTRLPTATQVDDAQAVLDWAADTGVQQIVTSYAPVGPTAECLAEAARAESAPAICRVMRRYDMLAWPHAKRGFFAFKKHIPDLLEDLRAPPMT